MRRRLRKRAHEAGETKVRLAEMLGALGVEIQAESLRRNFGSNRWNDEVRWDGYGTRERNGTIHRVHINSFSSMTDIVRSGQCLVVEDQAYAMEVSAP